jgi:hypothetical protein
MQHPLFVTTRTSPALHHPHARERRAGQADLQADGEEGRAPGVSAGAVRCVQVPSGKDLTEFYQQVGEAAVREWLEEVTNGGASS